MGITPAPKKDRTDKEADKAAEEIIGKAPDAGAPKRVAGKKQQISLTIEPTLLEQLDEVAGSLGVSRAAAFSLAVSRFVQQEKNR